MNAKIIYEDNEIIVAVKPAGVPSQPDKTGDEDILSMLEKHLNGKYVGLIHRLDRPVGGLMVFAKKQRAGAFLSNEVKNGRIVKTYYAVLCGKCSDKNGTLIDYLLKDERKNISSVVDKSTKNSKEAVLGYEILDEINTEAYGILSFAKINLKTGRHHQIRVQFANRNLPLWGDLKYNPAFKNKGRFNTALFSGGLMFTHPSTAETMSFDEIPKENPFDLFSV